MASILVNPIKQRVSDKHGLIIGSSGYIFFLIGGVIVTYCKGENNSILCSRSFIYSFNIIASMILGLSASLLWVC